MALTLALVRNTPNGPAVATETTSVRGTLASLKTVWLRPGTRLGFFTHMGTQFSVTVFALMWGVPYLTVAQGVSTGVAGWLLTISVVAAIVFGVVIGVFTGRHPHRRSRLVLAIIGSNALAWTVVLALPGQTPLWMLVVLIVVISVGGPGSMVGFDFARTFNPSATLGTAQAMVNMGGFLASLLVMQAMGLIMDAAGELLVRVVPAGVDRPVRDLDSGRGGHPDHPQEGSPADEAQARADALGRLRRSPGRAGATLAD